MSNSHALQGLSEGVIPVDNFYSSRVASALCSTSARSLFTLPSLSYRTTGALSLAKALQHNIPITGLRLSFLSPTSPLFFRQMPRVCVRTRLTILPKVSTRLASIHLYDTLHQRTRQCRPPQIRPALQWAYDRSLLRRDRGTPRSSSVLAGVKTPW